MDNTTVDEAFALDLILHPDYKTGVHADIFIFCPSHVISQLKLGWSAVDMRLGKGYDVAGRGTSDRLERGGAR